MNSSRGVQGRNSSRGPLRGGLGSSKRQVHRNFQTDKQKKTGGGKPPYPPDPPLLSAYIFANVFTI